MVHLRIVVPSYQSEHVLDLLANTASACNLIFLERAARKPEGDVILCDVAREDASVIVSDLRELDVLAADARACRRRRLGFLTGDRLGRFDPEKARAVLATQAAVNGKSVLDGEAVLMVPRRNPR